MNNLPLLAAELDAIVAREGDEPNDILASFVVGELIGDYDDLYEGLEDAYPDVRSIADLASDLEISNGNPEQLERMWAALKEHVAAIHTIIADQAK